MAEYQEIEKQARLDHVPVMLDDGMEFLLNYIKEHEGITRILEIGTAVGWSSMNMARIREGITIDTLEIDSKMYDQAVKNIREAELNDRIFVHLGDASLFTTAQYYDLFFVDAAKAQYRMYLEHFFQNSYIGSVFIFDNLNFHGLVDDISRTQNRHTIAMMKKIRKFREWLMEDERFDTQFYSNVGDGIAVARRIR